MKRGRTLQERALGYLARREHTRAELARKLAPHAEDPAEIEALLDELERRRWLSEARFAAQLSGKRRERFGSARIAQEMRQKGVSQAAVESALPALRDGDLEAARAVWAKKFGQAPRDAVERARQARFLQGRGFSLAVIRRLLRLEED